MDRALDLDEISEIAKMTFSYRAIDKEHYTSISFNILLSNCIIFKINYMIRSCTLGFASIMDLSGASLQICTFLASMLVLLRVEYYPNQESINSIL